MLNLSPCSVNKTALALCANAPAVAINNSKAGSKIRFITLVLTDFKGSDFNFDAKFFPYGDADNFVFFPGEISIGIGKISKECQGHIFLLF